MCALMFDFRFKNIFIMNNYVGIEKAIIATTRYNSKTLMPFCVQLIKKFILLQNTHKILAPKNDHWWCLVQD